MESQQAQSLESANILGTTTCPNGRNSCPGYGDLETRKYCCPSPLQPNGFYCCDYVERYQSSGGYFRNLPELAAGITGCLLVTALVLGCLFCRCCYLYKRRHRKRNAQGEPTETIVAASHRTRLNSKWRPSGMPVRPASTKYGLVYAYVYPHDGSDRIRHHVVEIAHVPRSAMPSSKRNRAWTMETAGTVVTRAERLQRGDLRHSSGHEYENEAPPSYAVAHYYPSAPTIAMMDREDEAPSSDSHL